MASEKNAVASYLEEKLAVRFGAGLTAGLHRPLQPGRLGNTIGKGVAGAGIAAAGAAAAALASMGASKLYDAATKTRDFNSMIQYDPELAALHQENPHRVNQMFSTLRMFNPDFTRDPVVASQYVKSMAEDPAHAGETAVRTLENVGKVRPMIGANVFQGGGSKKKK